MKINQNTLTFLYLLLTSMLIISCGTKDENPGPVNPTNGPTGTLFLHLHNYVDATEVDDYNIVYSNTNGRKLLLTKGQFYLSNFQLIKLDGSVYSVADSVVLKLQELETFQVADVPVGNYKSISFYVGLDDKTNKSSPATARPLLNVSDMWYGKNPQPDGFVFFNLQGKIDTTADASADEDQLVPFKYLLGTQAAYKKVTMPNQNYTISPDQVEYVHLYADCDKMFTGINVRDKNNLNVITPADNNSALATKLISNMVNIFSYEE